jgi:hypothetical protein
MANVNVDTQSAINTTRRVIYFQLAPGSLAFLNQSIIRAGLPMTYQVTTPADPAGHALRFEDHVDLDALVPGAPAKLTIFDTEYELVVHGDVQSDTRKLSWYRQRLYMLGYLTNEELEAADQSIPPEGAAVNEVKAFHDSLSVAFLEALLAFQADHMIPPDQDIDRESDNIKKTRAVLDSEAGS